MGAKPKAGGAKKRPAKAPAKVSKEKSQRERFIEAAREVGVSEDRFERAIKTIVVSRKPPAASSR